MKPKVSVIVPVYGVEKFIERCAVSLFEQTLQEIEYIFVDDCTLDNSIKKLELTLEKYPQRKKWTQIVRMPTNSGQARVRRHGIIQATGDYIIHCDSDDWVEHTMYEKLYNKAVAEDCDIVICDYYKAESQDKKEHISQSVSLEKDTLMRSILNETVHSAVWNKLIKASIYQNDIIYPKDNLREDLALLPQLLYFSNRIGYINEPLYYYFFNPNSITDCIRTYEKTMFLFNQSVNNYFLLENFLKVNKILCMYMKEMHSMQIRIKISGSSITDNSKGYKKWIKTFSELKISEVIHSQISIKSKLIYLLAYLRLFKYVRRLVKNR